MEAAECVEIPDEEAHHGEQSQQVFLVAERCDPEAAPCEAERDGETKPRDAQPRWD